MISFKGMIFPHTAKTGIQSPVKARHAFEAGDVRGLNAPAASRLPSSSGYLSYSNPQLKQFKTKQSSCNLGVASRRALLKHKYQR